MAASSIFVTLPNFKLPFLSLNDKDFGAGDPAGRPCRHALLRRERPERIIYAAAFSGSCFFSRRSALENAPFFLVVRRATVLRLRETRSR